MNAEFAIQEVLPTDTPNRGRILWNANDQMLANRLQVLTTSLQRLESQSSSGVINVKASPYQAVGNDRADDRAALQAAIDASAQAGGGTVFLPVGVYRLGGSLVLKDGVHLIGAGMDKTILKLGDRVNQPVLTDKAAGKPGGYAFGRVYLADFGIDGNRANNPEGQEGIFTTAYYSTFERLAVTRCKTHGLRFGFTGMANNSSQNRVVGCRIWECEGAGIYVDIKGTDHTLTENYIHNCTYGIVIYNGGVRVINNDLFGHINAGVLVGQTANGVLIAANDFNANQQHSIYVTSSTQVALGPWSQILITANTIMGDAVAQANRYDGIHVETEALGGIANLSITGNKIFSQVRTKPYRYGICLAKNVMETTCVANHIYNVATAPYFVGPNCSAITLDRTKAGALDTPPVPPNGVAQLNPFHAPVVVYVSGGEVNAVDIADQATGLTSGSFSLGAGQTITLHYEEAPTWKWFGC